MCVCEMDINTDCSVFHHKISSTGYILPSHTCIQNQRKLSWRIPSIELFQIGVPGESERLQNENREKNCNPNLVSHQNNKA